MKQSKPVLRIVWGILFSVSLYALILANGRTETVAFLGGVAVILVAERAKRTVNILVATAAAILLGFRGFYYQFYLYFTRTGEVDPTMTGRTSTWEDGLHLLWRSPWAGLGFQADRNFLGGTVHMHNAFLHVLVQAGILGGGAILVGLVITWYYLIKYFFIYPPADKSLIPPEIPAVFLFVTISSVAESTFAYFSAAWLLSAPIVAYVVALHKRQQRVMARADQGLARRHHQARRESLYLGPLSEAIPPGSAEDFPPGPDDDIPDDSSEETPA